MVLAVVTLIQLASPDFSHAVVSQAAPLVEESRQHESHTLTFGLKAANNRVFLFGRFFDESALEAHRGSAPYKDFRAWLAASPAVVTPVEDTVFEEVDPAPSNKEPSDGCLVFCGSRCGNDTLFVAHASELGSLLAKRKKTLVYGGGTVGMMGNLARAVLSGGGVVRGILPRALCDCPEEQGTIGEVIYVNSMSQRKTIMFSMSDTVIALPGGIGTFDELVEALVLYQLGVFRGKIGLLNTLHYFDPFVALLRGIVDRDFIGPDVMKYFVVAEDPEALLQRLDEMPSCGPLVELRWTAL